MRHSSRSYSTFEIQRDLLTKLNFVFFIRLHIFTFTWVSFLRATALYAPSISKEAVNKLKISFLICIFKTPLLCFVHHRSVFRDKVIDPFCVEERKKKQARKKDIKNSFPKTMTLKDILKSLKIVLSCTFITDINHTDRYR